MSDVWKYYDCYQWLNTPKVDDIVKSKKTKKKRQTITNKKETKK